MFLNRLSQLNFHDLIGKSASGIAYKNSLPVGKLNKAVTNINAIDNATGFINISFVGQIV